MGSVNVKYVNTAGNRRRAVRVPELAHEPLVELPQLRRFRVGRCELIQGFRPCAVGLRGDGFRVRGRRLGRSVNKKTIHAVNLIARTKIKRNSNKKKHT